MANWTLGYVIVGLIPVVFVGIAIWATIEERRSRQTPAEIDLEMQDYRRFWFPWTGAADDAEPSTKQVNNGGSSASVARAAPPAYPAVPMSPVQARSLALESVPSWIRRDPQSLVGGMTNGGSSTQDPKGKKKAWMAEPWPASHEVNMAGHDLPEDMVNPYRPYSLPSSRPGLPERAEPCGGRAPGRAGDVSTSSTGRGGAIDPSGAASEAFEEQPLQGAGPGRNLTAAQGRRGRTYS